MKDVSELLRAAVLPPQREVDMAAVAASARRRQRRHRFLAGAALATALALVGGVVLANTSGGPHIEVAPASKAANAAAHVSVDLPPGWQDLPRVERAPPEEILVVGTAHRPAGEPIQACLAGESLPAAPSAYVTLYEYKVGDGLSSPDGSGQYTPNAFGPRPDQSATGKYVLSGDCLPPVENAPTTSGTGAPVVPSSGSAVNGVASVNATPTPTSDSVPQTTTPANSTPTSGPEPSNDNHFREIPFTDGGRNFVARVVSVGDPTEELLNQGFRVLDTLVIDSGAVPPLDLTTTVPPNAAAPANEETARQQIRDAMTAAYGGASPIPIAESVEGGHPFSPAAAAAAATTPGALPAVEGKIVVQIHRITFDSPTHATVKFDLLVDGSQITATTTGNAVLEGAHWRMGRDTYCEIVARGGTLECPR